MPGGGVALEVDVVAGEAVVLAPEEVVEADLVERGRRGERRQVAADAVGALVGVDDHDRRVPADEGAGCGFSMLDVAGEPRLLVGGDGVDVGRGDLGRRADLALAGPLGELRHQEAGPDLALGVDDGVERVEPLAGLGRIGVGQLVDELSMVIGRASRGARVVGRPVHDAGIGAGYRWVAR